VSDSKFENIDIPSRPLALMEGKRGLIMGVANSRSIAWGIAKTLYSYGAQLAFTYQSEALVKRVKPLATMVQSEVILPCDVEDNLSVEKVFSSLEEKWGSIDFVVHAIAYSDKDELKGRYIDTSQENFLKTLNISCYSFTNIARLAEPLMQDGGALISLTFSGAERVMPNYNVMGIAKAALEASIKYLAFDMGSKGIRVNAISAGPMRTLAGSAISGSRNIFNFCQEHAPLKRDLSLDDIGGAALYLLSDLSASVTGEVHHVDSGYNIIGMPNPNH